MPRKHSKHDLEKRKADALALAELTLDLFKAKKASDKISGEKCKNGV